MGSLSFITSCVKYMLFLFNLVFVITGIILIAVGAAVAAEYRSYAPVLLDAAYTSVPSLLVSIGVIIFIVAFFGCCGAIKENYCMTLTFSTFLILIFILELAAGIGGYVLRGKTYDALTKTLYNSMPVYGDNNTEISTLWDNMQMHFKCCGVKGDEDWSKVSPVFLNGSLPMTCCEPNIGAINIAVCTTSSKNLHSIGCIDSLSDFIRSHAGSLGAAGLLIGIVQGIGIIFACHLARKTKDSIRLLN